MSHETIPWMLKRFQKESTKNDVWLTQTNEENICIHLIYIFSRCAASKSFHVSVNPGKHQCMQSSCFFPPVVEGWASALNSLNCVTSKIWKLDPLRALYRCWFTNRVSTFVPLLSKEKSSSTLIGRGVRKVKVGLRTVSALVKKKAKRLMQKCILINARTFVPFIYQFQLYWTNICSHQR